MKRETALAYTVIGLLVLMSGLIVVSYRAGMASQPVQISPVAQVEPEQVEPQRVVEVQAAPSAPLALESLTCTMANGLPGNPTLFELEGRANVVICD